ncbi:Maf family protein [Inmirania thermothiophila]|uniref:dTTP/UTP pyrophosphatase n=1 Tax=Inmirania thermothiophila TaxID=1750597 RepID=A0A3N1Y7S0_9GAMM|nr:nucleoside triphosphate pyrophosphatase [Inmirania thermothiophila]ROR34869.1 septum formation protein [Inmirania thermothiophila]
MTAPTIHLASRSPRRRALLAQIGLEAVVVPADVDESPRAGEAPAARVLRLARAKARAGAAAAPAGAVVLGADTEVVVDGEPLGKPADRAEARAMLARLAGRWHEVMTGVAVVHGGGEATRLSVTRVRFRDLDARELAAYAASGEGDDKAGGYAIQGLGAVLVARIEGSYSGVVGLPLAETAELLAAAGVRVLGGREEA